MPEIFRIQSLHYADLKTNLPNFGINKMQPTNHMRWMQIRRFLCNDWVLSFKTLEKDLDIFSPPCTIAVILQQKFKQTKSCEILQRQRMGTIDRSVVHCGEKFRIPS